MAAVAGEDEDYCFSYLLLLSDIYIMSQVRVRFAPSPTGFFHIGSARTALFNWLYARHTEGVFILRIEDTDKERNTEEAKQILFQGMKWLGLNWDEGPEVGGDYGPYYQSERTEIYRSHLEQLQKIDRAYEKDGAIYFKITGEPQVIEDTVRGRVERTEEKDFVIFRSDGSPVFHFVNVVDDITMGITHVIRGEDHLSNTSKHTELIKAFKAELPKYAHIPLLLKQQGPGKMSKRDQGSFIEEYERRYFLADAVRNYLCLLGWSPKDDREILPIDEIIQLFDLTGINKNNARFDEKKLSFINTDYLRALPLETFSWLCRPVLNESKIIPEDMDEDFLQDVLMICREKMRSIEELPGYCAYFFCDKYSINEKAKQKIFKKGDPLARLNEILSSIETLDEFSEEILEKTVENLTVTHNVSRGEYIHPTRLAVSGTNVGPGFYAMLQVLGKKNVLCRIKKFLAEMET